MTYETRHSPTQTVSHEARSWRCFFCDEVFTDPKAAANHFGCDHPGNEPLCKLAQVDGGIAKVIADLAETLHGFQTEDNASFREFYALGADHRAALIKEEQKGYDRGLADAGHADSTNNMLRIVLGNQLAMMCALHRLMQGFLSPDPLTKARLDARILATRALTDAFIGPSFEQLNTSHRPEDEQ
ncbi:hypothetical protein [Bradyrhizobium sp. BR 10261]|uniref:hypothetical protein n=1 Tax=Bradyrhizobium sp. BR 10261 TaxID=2749992 RepID=UPI001C64EB17|nr:hypothetical protein [Bradyrhizobium sp. BR 10261]MBW7966765.1 hypothetical protein [Bradyrhizobium sp. BR 10261]